MAAAEAGLEEEDYTWIKRSALTERAYFLGLRNGLSAITAKSRVSRLVFRALVKTLHLRAGDDTFAAGPLASACAALGRDLEAFSY